LIGVADCEPRPTDHIERPEKRRRGDPDLELVTVLRRDLDAERRRNVEVDLGPVLAPATHGLARAGGFCGLDRLRVLELRAHVVAVLVRA